MSIALKYSPVVPVPFVPQIACPYCSVPCSLCFCLRKYYTINGEFSAPQILFYLANGCGKCGTPSAHPEESKKVNSVELLPDDIKLKMDLQ